MVRWGIILGLSSGRTKQMEGFEGLDSRQMKMANGVRNGFE